MKPKSEKPTAENGKLTRLLEAAEQYWQNDDRDEAVEKYRAVLALDPDHLQALHYLNYALTDGRAVARDEAKRVEQLRLRDRVLRLTKGTAPGGELSLEQRARALALFQRSSELLLQAATRDELDQGLALVREAAALRPKLFEMTLALCEAIGEGRFGRAEAGYQKALDIIAASAPEFGCIPDALDDPGFLAWLAKRAPPPAGPAGQKALDKALLGVTAETGGRTGLTRALLALGANPRARNAEKGGRTALHFAAYTGDVGVIDALVAAGADPDARTKDNSREAPIHVAARYGGPRAIEALARAGADLDAASDRACSPFIDATPESIEALARAGADPNTGKHGTALHYAASFSQGPQVEALLRAGADPTRKNHEGKTAIQVALAEGDPALAKRMMAAAGAGKPPRGLDVKPLLVRLKKDRKAILQGSFFEGKSTRDLERILEAIGLSGYASWDEAAEAFRMVLPWNALAFVKLVRDVLPREERPAPYEKGARLVLGDLVVDGDLQVFDPLLVTGDLVVKGELSDAAPQSLVAVGGSIRARSLFTEGEIIVGGGVAVDEVIWAIGNDHSLRAGDIEARVFIEDQHEVIGGVDAAHHLTAEDLEERADLERLFVPGALSRGRLDPKKLMALAAKGKAYLRKGATTSTGG